MVSREAIDRASAKKADAVDIVARLHTDIAKVTRLPDVQKQLEGQGATTIGNTPEQFAAYIKSESAKWARVLAASGVKAD